MTLSKLIHIPGEYILFRVLNIFAHKHRKDLTQIRGGQIRAGLTSRQWFQWEQRGGMISIHCSVEAVISLIWGQQIIRLIVEFGFS